MAMDNSYSSDLPLLELFIKCAPLNREEKGACLLDHQWFMVFYSLVQRGIIDLRVTPVCLEYPPPNYEQLNAARRLPVAWIQEGVYNGQDISQRVATTTDELELMMESFGVSNLTSCRLNEKVRKAEKSFEDLFHNTILFMKYGNSTPLMASLKSLEDYLAQCHSKYLINNEISYPDCLLMPKLQHMRVILQAYHNWTIPREFVNIWRYIKDMYSTAAFDHSCPNDSDILMHYNEKCPLPKSINLRAMGNSKLSSVVYPGKTNGH